jgi:hypothetical protein
VEKISRNKDDIANPAAQAELRVIHAKAEDAYKELTLTRLEVKPLSNLVSFQAAQIFQVATCIYYQFSSTSVF